MDRRKRNKVNANKEALSKQVIHFETPSLSAEFTEDNGHIYTKALVLVEGDHIDSKQRKHSFPAERVRKIAENTNQLLQQGARLPLLTDHQKTQDTTIGDVVSELEARIITEDDIKDNRYKHLVGKFGAFANQIVIKARKAVEQYKDRLLSTISPGIDIVSDTIREISCTSTPAIVGLQLFNRDLNLATFALSFDELEQSGDQIEQLKQQYDNLTDDLWIVLTSILTADDDDLQENNQTDLLENALDDFENRLLGVLGIQPEDDEEDNPQDYQQEDQQALQVGKQMPQQTSMPRTYNQRASSGGQYSNSNNVLAAFTMDEMEKLAQFGIGETISKAASNIGSTIAKQRKNISGAIKETKNAAEGGFLQAKAKSAIAGAGKLKSNLSGIGGGIKRAYGTTGGKVALGAAGAVAGAGAALGAKAALGRMRKPKQPKM